VCRCCCDSSDVNTAVNATASSNAITAAAAAAAAAAWLFKRLALKCVSRQ